jgi:hypothetical protein
MFLSLTDAPAQCKAKNNKKHKFFSKRDGVLIVAKKGKKKGPKPNRLKLDGDWEDIAKRVIQKKKPKGEWPKEGKKGSKSK